MNICIYQLHRSSRARLDQKLAETKLLARLPPAITDKQAVLATINHINISKHVCIYSETQFSIPVRAENSE